MGAFLAYLLSLMVAAWESSIFYIMVVGFVCLFVCFEREIFFFFFFFFFVWLHFHLTGSDMDLDCSKARAVRWFNL